MGEKGRVWFMAWSSRRFNWFDLCGGGAERCQKNTFCTRFEIKTGEFGRKPETEILHNCKLWGMIDKCKMHFQGLCKGTPELKLKYVTKIHFRKMLEIRSSASIRTRGMSQHLTWKRRKSRHPPSRHAQKISFLPTLKAMQLFKSLMSLSDEYKEMHPYVSIDRLVQVPENFTLYNIFA